MCWPACLSTMSQLFSLSHHSVHRAFTSNKHFPISEDWNDDSRRKITKLRLVDCVKNAPPLEVGHPCLWSSTLSSWTGILTNASIPSTPPLNGSYRQIQDIACIYQSCTGFNCFIDHCDSSSAIRGTDHCASPNPQIASAFFRKIIKAAASVISFSFLAISRSRS